MKAVSRAGTRSVASLTPDQLARKRANDREAQRSIRQRTKTHIEELERRIQDLSAEHDEKNIEELQRRNAELEEELRQLKEILGRPDSNMGSSASSASSPDLTPLSCKYEPLCLFLLDPSRRAIDRSGLKLDVVPYV